MSSVFRALADRLPLGWKRSSGSLRTQLILGNVIALWLLLIGLGVVCHYVALAFMLRSVDQELDRSIRRYMRRPRFDMSPGERDRRPPPGPPREPGREGGPRRPPDSDSPYSPHVFNSDRTPEMPNDSRPILDGDALTRALRGDIVRRSITVNGEPVRLLSSPKPDQRGKVGAVQNAYPLKEVYRAVAGVDTALLLLMPVGLVSAWLVGSMLTQRVLRRVHLVTQTAGQIGADNFANRLPVSGNDEFSEMAKTFNGLLGRLEAAYQEQKRLLEQQRRFTADASHELKTPLTVIKGTTSMTLNTPRTEEAYRAAMQNIDTAADSMSHLVQDLLMLARSDAGQLGRNPIQLPLREILERAIASVPENHAPIALEVEDDTACVMGNESELVRLFSNLLENARRYTPLDGSIRVTTREAPDNVGVSVEDTGIGIAPEHLPHLGERFYRVDTARSRPDGGAGLGLSICQSIVEAHHGTMTIDSVLGQGTKVTVSLPKAPVEIV